MTARALSWDDLSEGMEVALPFAIDDAAMEIFAKLSMDRNPLHLDDEFARRRGFPGRVVYGGLIVAQISRLIGMHLPGRDGLWSGLKLDFRKPLYIGVEAVLEAELVTLSPATRSLSIRLRVIAGDAVICTGSVEAVMPADD